MLANLSFCRHLPMIISESSAEGDVRVGKTQLFTSGQRVPASGKQRCDMSPQERKIWSSAEAIELVFFLFLFF